MKYLIWLQSVLNIGNNRVKDILKFFGSAENVYNADYKEILCHCYKGCKIEEIKQQIGVYRLREMHNS